MCSHFNQNDETYKEVCRKECSRIRIYKPSNAKPKDVLSTYLLRKSLVNSVYCGNAPGLRGKCRATMHSLMKDVLLVDHDYLDYDYLDHAVNVIN
jgi:hypothetical protein